MKKLILASVTLILALSIYAQPRGYHDVFHTYCGQEGVTSIRVPGFLLKFVAMCEGLDGTERQLVRSLKSVSVLTIDDPKCHPGVNFVEEMDYSRMLGEYQLLMEVHDGDEDVIIAAREQRGKITDLIVVVGGEENTLVHVRGRMHCDLLEELAEISGIKQLEITAEI